MVGDNVRIGQVWADNDYRIMPRKMRVVVADNEYVTLENLVTKRRTRARRDRFRPTSTGYRLVRHA